MKKYIIISIFLIGLILAFIINKGNKHQISQSIPEGMKHYSQTVNNLNEGWANIRIGDSYRKSGEMGRAIEAYKRAYDIDPGNRVYIGDILIKTYEKLEMYDEAISVVDDILQNQRLAEKGVKDFTEMRARLISNRTTSQGETLEVS